MSRHALTRFFDYLFHIQPTKAAARRSPAGRVLRAFSTFWPFLAKTKAWRELRIKPQLFDSKRFKTSAMDMLRRNK